MRAAVVRLSMISSRWLMARKRCADAVADKLRLFQFAATPPGVGRRVLISRPKPRRRQLEQMPVGIAEIDAVAAARPIGAAFDGDALLAQSPLPLRQLIHGNGKGHVQRSLAVVRGVGAARHAYRFERRA